MRLCLKVDLPTKPRLSCRNARGTRKCCLPDVFGQINFVSKPRFNSEDYIGAIRDKETKFGKSGERRPLIFLNSF